MSAGHSTLSEALTREHLRIDFKCGCFTVLWAEKDRVQGGTSCCQAHNRLGPTYNGMEGKTVYNVRPGTLLNGPDAGGTT